MMSNQEDSVKQSLEDIELVLTNGCNPSEVQLMIKATKSCIDIGASVISETQQDYSIKKVQSAPNAISVSLVEHGDLESQHKTSNPKQASDSEETTNDPENNLEKIFGEKTTFVDGEELIEVVDTRPQGPVYYCCKNGEISKGSYATVFKGYSMKGDEKLPVALKLLKYKHVQQYYQDRELGQVPAEVYVMNQLQDLPATTRLHLYHKLSEEQFVIISERPENSRDLFEMACDGLLPFSEEQARTIIRQIARVLRAMEKKKIIHRDVKVDNILFDLKTDEAKLIDFGMALQFKSWERIKNIIGTAINWPPEYLTNNSFDPRKETTWALGTVLFSLVNGVRPFTGIAHALSTPLYFFKDVSPECKSLIQGMLHLNPKKRLSLKKVLKHPWVTGERKRSIFSLPAFVRRCIGRP